MRHNFVHLLFISVELSVYIEYLFNNIYICEQYTVYLTLLVGKLYLCWPKIQNKEAHESYLSMAL